MIGLITDRTQENLDRLKELNRKGFENMTPAEKAEWSGNPLDAELIGYDKPVNLIPFRPYYSDSVELVYRNTSITARVTQPGTYLYAVIILGEASYFEGKTLTLSAYGMVRSSKNVKPMAAVYWHDNNGFEWGGGSLSDAGRITFQVAENAGNRMYLALYLYGTTDAPAEIGDYVGYQRLMLEFGGIRHEYVPYTPILPTPATKGAYNHSDLNRVEMAVAEISEYFGLNLVTKTDWDVWEIPNQQETDRIIKNLGEIRYIIDELHWNNGEIPVLPVRMDGLTFDAANKIEQILSIAGEVIP